MRSPERTFKPMYTESPGRSSGRGSGYHTPVAGEARLLYNIEDSPRYYYDDEDERPGAKHQFIKVIAILVVVSCSLIVVVEVSRRILVHFFTDSKDA